MIANGQMYVQFLNKECYLRTNNRAMAKRQASKRKRLLRKNKQSKSYLTKRKKMSDTKDYSGDVKIIHGLPLGIEPCERGVVIISSPRYAPPESEKLNIHSVSNRLFKEEMIKLALEKYPVQMTTTGDDPKEWDMNEQYRECWIDGYMCFLNGC